MYISYKWLKKYVPNVDTVKPEDLAEKLTNSIAEVDSVEYMGSALTKVVCGEVLKVVDHPESDKLHVCEVNLGSEQLQIVCGAQNVRPGLKVAVCTPGGSVYNPKALAEDVAKYNSYSADALVPAEIAKAVHFQIIATKIRGVESNGMICSEKELGIGDNHEQILELPGNMEVGTDLDDMFSDVILEIENKSLTHRGDCFSHLGIAREVAALFDLEYLPLPAESIVPQTEALPLEVEIESDKCNRFTILTIKGVKVQPSPLWIRLALQSIKIRSVNNIVDITNYLMHDSGQPLHAYDYRKVKDNKLIVRQSRAGEKIEALDGKEYKLPGAELIITDNSKILNIAGIIGSENSGVTEETTDIILEAANFDATSTLTTSRQLGIRTEASVRNGKGVDLNLTRKVISKAAELVIDVAGGDVASEILDIVNETETTSKVTADLMLFNRIAGVNIPLEDMVIFLERLGLKVTNKNNLNLANMQINVPVVAEIEIPSWRNDLRTAQDISEEVIRIYGYDKIQPKLPARNAFANRISGQQKLQRKVRHLLLRQGFSEVINYSFISKQIEIDFGLKRRQLLEITNALSPELNYFRNSLIPGLVTSYFKNYRHQQEQSLFEIGRIVDNYTYTEEKLPAQPYKLGVIHGYITNDSGVNVFNVFKGVVETLLISLGLSKELINFSTYIEQDLLPVAGFVHPNRSATVKYNGRILGIVSEISPQTLTNFNSSGSLGNAECRVLAAELDMQSILDLVNETEFSYQPLINFPSSIRDLSVWIGPRQSIGEMEAFVNSIIPGIEQTLGIKKYKINSTLVEEFRKSDKERSITFRFTIQPLQENLTDSEANAVADSILKELKAKYKVTAR